MSEKKLNKKLIIIVSVIAAVALIATVAVIVMLSQRETVADVLDLGDRYMSELDYESAIREYKRAIEIDPRSEDAYLKLAEAYIALGDVDSAIEALEDGYAASNSERILVRLNELRGDAASTAHSPDDAESIVMASTPQKTTYNVGDMLDLTGLTLTVTYQDGATEVVSGGYTCEVETLDEAGTQEVTVRYGGAETKFTVTVEEPTVAEISILTMPDNTAYFVGDTLDLTGLTLTVTYNDGATEVISDGYTCEVETLDEAGTQEITVRYGGSETKFTLTVEEPTITDMSIMTMPTKTSYFVGEILDTAGLSLNAKYNDGSTDIISEGFICDPTTLDTVGEQEITVLYTDHICTFMVEVREIVLTDVTINTMPDKTAYYVGDKLNTSGLSLIAAYSDGHNEIAERGFSCDKNVFDTPGKQSIIVSYNGKTTTFDINVTVPKLIKISINSLPYTQSYLQGETIDTKGLTLTAIYENGTSETVKNGFSCQPNVLNDVGEQKITVEYNGKEAEFYVTVKEASNPFEFNGHHYRVIYDADIGWHDAKAECEMLGGHLATITSEEENMFVYNLVTELGVSCWLGGTDEENEGEWKWVTGEEWSYESADFNNDSGLQHYLVINYIGSAIWDDQSEKDGGYLCDTEGYVCEWE